MYHYRVACMKLVILQRCGFIFGATHWFVVGRRSCAGHQRPAGKASACLPWCSGSCRSENCVTPTACGPNALLNITQMSYYQSLPTRQTRGVVTLVCRSTCMGTCMGTAATASCTSASGLACVAGTLLHNQGHQGRYHQGRQLTYT